MTKTIENLKEAFAGESQASMKYRIFAEKADAEGFGQAARMFRAASQAEKLHAETHLKNLEMVNDTATNLQAAVDGETYEFSTMYPEFIKEGETEGAKAAVLKGFQFASDAEKVHADIYSRYLTELKQGPASVELYLCNICGHIAEGEAPETCPLCGAKKMDFKKVD